MKTWIIVTMAGRGQRFRDVGYCLPKYEIEVCGRPAFDWAIASLGQFITAGARLVFVGRAENEAAKFIDEASRRIGFGDHRCVELDDETAGQAATAVAGACAIGALDEPVCITNIDTHVDPSMLSPRSVRGAGWIPCFEAPGDRWSFARTLGDDRVVEVREKQRISANATVGFYSFESIGLFVDAYDRTYGADSAKRQDTAGEHYVAPLYNRLIEDGRDVYLSRIPFDSVIDLGTPQQLEAFVAARAARLEREQDRGR